MSRNIEQIRALATMLALRRLGYSMAEVNSLDELDITSDDSASHSGTNSDQESQHSEKENIVSECIECEQIISRLTRKNIAQTRFAYNFNHIAAIISWQNKEANVLCYGQNHSFNDGSSTHAEVDAMHHLPPRKNCRQRLQVVNLLVVRVSRTGIIGNSAPCIHCLRTMTHLPPRMGYYIDKIYFSNAAGEIVSYKLDSLIEIDEQHVTSFHRNKENGTNGVCRIMEWRKRYLERRNKQKK